MQTKICTKCNQEKEIKDFYKLKRGKYGVESVCILCKKSPSAKKRFLIPKGFKCCTICNIEKPIEEFYKSNQVKDGVIARCKICDKLKYKESRRLLRKKNKLKVKNQSLIRSFGITLEDYNRMLEAQNGVCAICGKSEIIIDKRISKLRALTVDHNHKTGKVRGLLCARCNQALGLFKENSDVCFIAGKYLQKYKDT